jgi:hypothetical protein
MVSEGDRDCCRIGQVTAVLAVIYELVFTTSLLRFRTLRLASMLLGGNCCSSTFARSRLCSGGIGFRGFGQLSRALD